MKRTKSSIFVSLFLHLHRTRQCKTLPTGFFSDFNDVFEKNNSEGLLKHYCTILESVLLKEKIKINNQVKSNAPRILVPRHRILLPRHLDSDEFPAAIQMTDSSVSFDRGSFLDIKRIAKIINSEARFTQNQFHGSHKNFQIEEVFNMSGKSKIHIEGNDFHADVKKFIQSSGEADITVKTNTFRGKVEEFIVLTPADKEIIDVLAVNPVEMRQEICEKLVNQPRETWISKINDLSVFKYIEASEKIGDASQKIYNLWEKISPLISSNSEFIKKFLS